MVLMKWLGAISSATGAMRKVISAGVSAAASLGSTAWHRVALAQVTISRRFIPYRPRPAGGSFAQNALMARLRVQDRVRDGIWLTLGMSRAFEGKTMLLCRRFWMVVLLLGLGCGLLTLCGLAAYAQGRLYSQGRYGDLEARSREKAEFYWSRLRYTYSGGQSNFGFGFGYGGWAGWSRDYPKADRQFLIALKRLTRFQMRPVEQFVDLDSDENNNNPKNYAVQ